MASTNSPCAACKLLRRKCTQECVFAPYFPPDQPNKFANVHKVFGASNVAKLLSELSTPQREEAVNSLAYEADSRLRDPVYGCVGYISLLQQSLKEIHHDLMTAKKELSSYIGPSAMLPIAQPHYPMLHQTHHLGNSSSSMAAPFGNMQMGLNLQPPSQTLTFREQQQQQQEQMLEAQQLAMAAMAVREQHEMMRNYEQQQQQPPHQAEVVRYNRFDGGGNSSGHGFSQMGAHSQLALVPFDNPFQVQDQVHMHQQSHHHQKSESDDSKSCIGPSS